MKKMSSKQTIIKQQKPISAAFKAKLIREATRVTLQQYAKTFADLARYDRTEKARS